MTIQRAKLLNPPAARGDVLHIVLGVHEEVGNCAIA
ncbi:MAG: hypothetical protein QOI88_491 [Gammaproteobacteria bacterium]|jgi:hypothetical protein|nr:hypothetical protein [Gammaproteobacteria bacterium]